MSLISWRSKTISYSDLYKLPNINRFCLPCLAPSSVIAKILIRKSFTKESKSHYGSKGQFDDSSQKFIAFDNLSMINKPINSEKDKFASMVYKQHHQRQTVHPFSSKKFAASSTDRKGIGGRSTDSRSSDDSFHKTGSGSELAGSEDSD